MIKTRKVVLARDLVQAEKRAQLQGSDASDFMQKAGENIALAIAQIYPGSKPSVTLLVGKGNNGGDAYAAGTALIRKGFSVEAMAVYPQEECSPLCRKQHELFLHVGGKVVQDLPLTQGIILDGLVGTGFRGGARGILAEVIQRANASGLPIFAIDIPSGLCGDTGAVETVAIKSSWTIYLQFPKLGFFLKDGWNHVGTLLRAEFGLPEVYAEEIEAKAYLVEHVDVLSCFPNPKRDRHKYQAGYLLCVAGSPGMMGAGLLSSYSALRAGSGIVRWYYPPLVKQAPDLFPEVIRLPLEDLAQFLQQMKRSGALVIGPGLGREKKVRKLVQAILSSCTVPVVIDADALDAAEGRFPAQSLLTPHRGEMERLYGGKCEDWLSAYQQYVKEKDCALLLKGAPNFLFSPGEIPLILPFGNPGLATAGTGDVLSGILGALLSQKNSPRQSAIIGTYLHGFAADLALEKQSLFSLLASDLVSYLPKAIARSLQNNH